MQEQFRSLGHAVEVDPDEEGMIAVMACNWPSLEAFLACSTQWRTATVTIGGAAGIMSHIAWIGLDYTACDVVLRARNAPAHVLADIMEMERAALPHLNEVD